MPVLTAAVFVFSAALPLPSIALGDPECVYHSDIDPYYLYGDPVGYFLYNYDD